jgi:hypothetical protein
MTTFCLLEYNLYETFILKIYINACDVLQTSEYIIVSGARRQENRWDPNENEQIVPEDKNTSKRLFDDAMFKLEHGYGDKSRADGVQPTLAKLTAKRQKVWQDDYAANCVLRQHFRVGDFFFMCEFSLYSETLRISML